jgi:microcystin-dependent protein
MTETPNLGLQKPGDNGTLDIEVIDVNMDIIDGAVAGLQDGKEPVFSKNSGFNKNKSDSYSLNDSNTLATSKALKDGLATTFKTSDCYYGIGDYWITESSTNPATKWTGTTWNKVEGKMLFGADGTTYTVGAEGGVTQVTLELVNVPSHRHHVDSHSHTQASHFHYIAKNSATTAVTSISLTDIQYMYSRTQTNGYDESYTLRGQSTEANVGKTSSNGGDNTGTAEPYTTYQGNGQAFSVLNSYRAVNIWRRTA